MKRSPPAAALSSSCSSSSSVGFESPKRRRKRPTRTLKPRQSNTDQNQAINGCRRSSIYRGVTRHRLTGRFEAHLWDKSSWNSVQTKKGRQVYLGAYDIEETAARTYDLAALKYWGKEAILNFPIETYTKEFEEMDKFTREEYLASLRRHSNGFSRGVSKYRGVARHHHNGRWEARIGRVNGSKYIYLGTFETQEEAAEAYDKAALEYRGVNAVTNFDKRKYKDQIAERKSEQSQETGTVQKKKKKSEQSQTTGTVPNFSESEGAEVLRTTKQAPPENPVTQQQQQQQKHQSVQCSDVPQTMESPPVTTSSVVDNNVPDQDLPWSFMDSGLPDMTLSNADDFLSMFDGVDFDADIHFLFGSEPTESDFSLSAVLGSIGCEDVLCGAAGNKNNVDDIKQNKQSSSSSPASSSSSFSSSHSSPKDTSPSPKSP